MSAQPTKRRKRHPDERPVRIFQAVPAEVRNSCDGCAARHQTKQCTALCQAVNRSTLPDGTRWLCSRGFGKILKEITK